MSRIFMSHHHEDSREAVALKQWLAGQDPPLAQEIFLDLDRDTGIAGGTRWKNELLKEKSRCEAVICLLSVNWAGSLECRLEFRNAEDMGKQVICGRLEPSPADDLTRDWQCFDLIGEGEQTQIDIGDGGPPVSFRSDALYRLRDGVRGAGISAESFPWPPSGDSDPQPYRGWEPLEEHDAGIFFGRDGELVLALDALREMRRTQHETLFVVLGPSGSGKSSFLRAGILPRLRREDHHYLVFDILRPERRALSGKTGFANTVYLTRRRLGLEQPTLGEIKAACSTDPARVRELLAECRHVAAARIPGADTDLAPPTVVLAIDQAEELFSADAGPEAAAFLQLIAQLADPDAGVGLGLIVSATIRTDRYEPMQTAASLTKLRTRLFGELKPMPPHEFREVVAGPARRFSQEVHQLRLEPALVNQLVEDCKTGAEALPLLALTLARLFEDYGSANDLTLAQYRQMGGMNHVVQTQVDEVLSADPTTRATQLAAARAAFIPWLATINPDNDKPMRRVARRSDLPEASWPVIDAMVERRLLIQDRRDGDVVIEVALESLLRQWGELAEWLSEEREILKAADDLERAAKAWQEHDRDDAWLLEGTRLVSAETVAAEPGFVDRLAGAADYLHASRRRENNRLQAEHQRDRDAIARRLIDEAKAMMARRLPDGDIRAFQQLLVARALQAQPDDGPILNALKTHPRTLKIVGGVDYLLAVAFSPNGLRLATASCGGESVQLWDTESGQPLGEPLAGRDGSMYQVAFSPDGQRLVTFGDTVQLWETETGHPIAGPLDEHTGPVSCVAFSPDGQRLATADSDQTVRWWDARSGDAIDDPLSVCVGPVTCVAFSLDGQRLATASGFGAKRGRHGRPETERIIRLWDTHTGQPSGGALTGHTATVETMAFSPDGQYLASAGGFPFTVQVWNLDTGQPVGGALTRHTDTVQTMAFSPDGQRLATGSYDETVQVWDVHTGHPVGDPLTGHTQGVHSVAFSPDGQRLASASGETTVRLWDVHTGNPLAEYTGNVKCLAFSPDGQRLATGSYDQTVRLWDVHTGQPLGDPFTGHTGPVNCVAFSPDGQRLFTHSDEDVSVCDAHSGEPIGEPLNFHTDDSTTCVAFSPDGQRLATGGSDQLVRVWNADTGQPLGDPLTGHTGWVSCVAFSPDGQRLASASDGTVRLWDIHTGQPLGDPLTGHTDTVNGVAFSPDGQRLASASDDTTVRAWDAHTGQPLGDPLTGHTSFVKCVAFSPDGQRLASVGTDFTVRMWLGATYPEMLCRKLAANMSRKQWRDWVSPDIDYIPACPELPVPPDDSQPGE
jgi:WD40 repeat protein